MTSAVMISGTGELSLSTNNLLSNAASLEDVCSDEDIIGNKNNDDYKSVNVVVVHSNSKKNTTPKITTRTVDVKEDRKGQSSLRFNTSSKLEKNEKLDGNQGLIEGAHQTVEEKNRLNAVKSRGGGGDDAVISLDTPDIVVEMENKEESSGKVVNVVADVPEQSSSSSCFQSEKKRLAQVLQKKQELRAQEFSKLQTKYKLEGENLRIANLTWEDLVTQLQTRELSATSALEAYIAKSLECTSKFNSITEFIPQAHEWASKLDNMKGTKGPLHGLPFCVKDDTNVKGMDTTHGYVKQCFQPAQDNATIVKILLDLGAVPFCKTNVPQTLFTYGSDNPVFGTTTNCINPKLAPGGSSSGTGSLVGSKGCMFGTGTDIGGSLRIPAHFNGCASIKPTVGRLSDTGVVSSLPNLIGLTAVPGIIGQTPTVVSTVFKAMLEDKKQNAYDPKALPISWDAELFTAKKKYRVGYFTTLPFFPAMGDTEEVVMRAKSSLESLGHTLVPVEMPDSFHYMRTVAKFLLADQNRHFLKCMKGEKVAQSTMLIYLSSFVPNFVQKIVSKIMNTKCLPFIYSSRTALMLGAGATTSKELWEAKGEKQKVIDQMFNEWEKLKLDALICPTFPFPAPKIDLPGLLPQATAYSMLWNIVDFPCGIVPFGRESGKNFLAFDHEGDAALKLAHKGIKESVGAPIGVQVVALPYKEETVLKLMVELEKFSYKQ